MRLWVVALVVLAAVGVAALAVSTSWAEVGRQLARLPAAGVALLLILSLVNYGARAARWLLLCHGAGIWPGWRRGTLHYVAGFAMVLTPARAGELVRLRWLSRATGARFEATLPLALADRASDLAAIGLVLAGAVAVGAAGQAGVAGVAATALLLALAATRPGLLRWGLTLLYRATGRGGRTFGRLRGAAASLGPLSAPAILLPATLLGVGGWLAEGVAFALLLDWLEAPTAPATAVAIFLAATLTGGATGVPGGVGGAEAAMLAALTLDGVEFDTAVAATAVIRLTTLWFAVVLGLITFPLAEARA